MSRDRLRGRVALGLAACAAICLALPATSATAGSSGLATFKQAHPHHPLHISNRYFSLRPRTTYGYYGSVVDADGRHRHRVVFTVTDLVKNVGGTWTRVAWDRDIQDGVLSEAELALFAQDDRHRVRSLGEYPEEYEHGHITGAPSTWLDGVGDAYGGVLVPGRPVVGTRFVEGKALSIDFFDVGRVVRRDAHTCVPIGCFDHVLVINEWSPLAPEDGHQLKYYAPGVGLVRVSALGGDSQERMTLQRIVHLGPVKAAHVRRVVRRVDARGRHTNAVWAQAPSVLRHRTFSR